MATKTIPAYNIRYVDGLSGGSGDITNVTSLEQLAHILATNPGYMVRSIEPRDLLQGAALRRHRQAALRKLLVDE